MIVTNYVSKAELPPSLSNVCINHIMMMFQHILKGSPWALKMLDSTSKISTSILEGNILDYGSYDECLSIKVKEDWGSFVGQHCLNLFILSPEDIPSVVNSNTSVENTQIPVAFSVCLPSSCSPGDLQFMMSKLSDRIIVDPVLCHTSQQQVPLNVEDWIGIFIITTIGLLCLLSTSYELLQRKKGNCSAWVQMFSWYSNGKKLFVVNSSSDPLNMLHGLRFFSIVWITMGHSYINNKLPALNLISNVEKGRDWWHLLVLNAVFGVDTFFVISGLLLCYTFMKLMESGNKFNLPVFYLHRYFRITPMLVFIILIHIVILPRLGDGPLWDIIQYKISRKSCVTDWWNTLLYIHNYYHSQFHDMCIGITWYLAVDMQLFWLSPILLIMLKKQPKIGLITILIACVIGMIINFVNAYVNSINLDVVSIEKNFDMSNYHTHTRFIPWLLGILCGYFMYKTTDWRAHLLAGRVTFPKKYIISGWIIAIGCIIITGISAHPFQQKSYQYSALDAAFYSALTGPLWSLAIVWIIFSCASGFGGFVNTLLSWEFLHPLGRLSFCIYLIHNDFIFGHIASKRTASYKNDLEQMGEIFGDIVLTILVSIVASLSVEAPFMTMEKMLFYRSANKNQYTQKYNQLKNLDDLAKINSEMKLLKP